MLLHYFKLSDFKVKDTHQNLAEIDLQTFELCPGARAAAIAPSKRRPQHEQSPSSISFDLLNYTIGCFKWHSQRILFFFSYVFRIGMILSYHWEALLLAIFIDWLAINNWCNRLVMSMVFFIWRIFAEPFRWTRVPDLRKISQEALQCLRKRNKKMEWPPKNLLVVLDKKIQMNS